MTSPANGQSKEGLALASAVTSIVVARPYEETRHIVSDIGLLEPFERKVETIEIVPESDSTGRYSLIGRVFGFLPWRGDFSYQHHAAGWHSETLGTGPYGVRVSGGFSLTRVDEDHTRVTHYEDYLLPKRFRLIRGPFSRYIAWTQRGEMRDIKQFVAGKP
jgi:hypothetical protein